VNLRYGVFDAWEKCVMLKSYIHYSVLALRDCIIAFDHYF